MLRSVCSLAEVNRELFHGDPDESADLFKANESATMDFDNSLLSGAQPMVVCGQMIEMRASQFHQVLTSTPQPL